MKNDAKRVFSIRRRLHFGLILKKIQMYFCMDLLVMLVFLAAWGISQEIHASGNFDLMRERKIEREEERSKIYYQVYDDHTKILEIDFAQPAEYMKYMILVVFVVQILDIIISCRAEGKKIRKILKPLDELALKADELSKMTFSGDQFQEIENALDSVVPGDENTLSLGDTELKGVEAAINNLLLRIRESNRQQSRFVNDASHELRTPIAVIQGYVDMLDRWGKSDEKVLDESITAIKTETEHMKHLVEQLLFLARGDSGKMNLEMKKVSLRRLAAEIYEESLMIDEEHIYRLGKAADEDIFVEVDEGLFKQAVRILVDNAAKYTSKGEEIMISTGRDEKGCSYIQVQDTGIGMEGKDVARMFERFYRSDDARGYQGTGLGLSIAKWIVDKHKGHFEILSRTELGTRIRIVL